MTPFQSGTVKRTKPVLQVNNGYDPMSPQSAHRQLRLPVAAGDVNVIKSGMVISTVWNAGLTRYEWQAGIPTGYNPEQIAFANADGNDYDVVAAGGLPGLLCSGTFDINTGYFAGNITDNGGAVNGALSYVARGANLYLTPCLDTDAGEDGEGVTKAAGALSGYLKLTVVESGEPIVGVLHGTMNGAFDLGPTFTGSAASSNDAGMKPGQNSSASETKVIRLLTRLSINSVDAVE